MILKAILIIALSYLVGSIPFGVIIGRVLKGVDIRDSGSGNIGAANAIRTLGLVPGILVLLLDIAKGVFAVYLSTHLMPKEFIHLMNVAAGLTAIIGHNYSIFLKFKGGKGIATSFGVFVALNWQIALICLATYIIIVAITRYSSLGSLSGTFAMPVCMYIFHQPVEYFWFSVIAAAFAFYKHKENIKRLLKGEEIRMFNK